jgi:hypothetical protein
MGFWMDLSGDFLDLLKYFFDMYEEVNHQLHSTIFHPHPTPSNLPENPSIEHKTILIQIQSFD